MSRYFFHTDTDIRFTDEEGIECISHVDARRNAIVTCGEIMRECAETFWGSRPWTVTVTDATGLILWQISLDGVAAPAVASGSNEVHRSPEFTP